MATPAIRLNGFHLVHFYRAWQCLQCVIDSQLKNLTTSRKWHISSKVSRQLTSSSSLSFISPSYATLRLWLIPLSYKSNTNHTSSTIQSVSQVCLCIVSLVHGIPSPTCSLLCKSSHLFLSFAVRCCKSKSFFFWCVLFIFVMIVFLYLSTYSCYSHFPVLDGSPRLSILYH